MLSIKQANNLRGSTGVPLPTVIQPLARMGCHLRAGEVSLWGAGSGTGKSVLCHWIALGVRVPVLYFSADSNSATMRKRTASMLTGMSQDEAWTQIENDQGHASAVLTEANHVKWAFESSPDLREIEEELNAFWTAFGEYPRMVVVDNLRNVSGGSGGDEYVFWDEVMGWLHDMAVYTESHVAVTHHVTGMYAAGDKQIPLSGLENKVDKRAEVVVTAYKTAGRDDMINLSVVKNRGGRAMGDGSYSCTLGFDGARMQLSEL